MTDNDQRYMILARAVLNDDAPPKLLNQVAMAYKRDRTTYHVQAYLDTRRTSRRK